MNRKRQRLLLHLDRPVKAAHDTRTIIGTARHKNGTGKGMSHFAPFSVNVFHQVFHRLHGRPCRCGQKGIVKVRYGTQRSPIDPTLEIKSNGVRIATERNAQVRAVFEGEVLAVMGKGIPTHQLQKEEPTGRDNEWQQQR